MAERPVQLRKHVTHSNRTKIIGDASGKQEEIKKNGSSLSTNRPKLQIKK